MELERLVFYCYETQPEVVLSYLQKYGLNPQYGPELLDAVCNILTESDEDAIAFFENCHPDFGIIEDAVLQSVTDLPKVHKKEKNSNYYYQIHIKDAVLLVLIGLIALIVFKK